MDFKELRLKTIRQLINRAFRLRKGLQINYSLLTPVNFKFNGVVRIDRLGDISDEVKRLGPEAIPTESGISNRLQKSLLLWV